MKKLPKLVSSPSLTLLTYKSCFIFFFIFTPESVLKDFFVTQFKILSMTPGRSSHLPYKADD